MEKAGNDGDIEIILRYHDELAEALNEMDTLLIDEVMEKFDQFELTGQTEQDYLKALHTAAEKYDLDTCQQIVDEWKEYLN